MSEQKVIIGNCLDVLRSMPDESVDVCVTSPPYWALRDYGSELVLWGGNADCEHEWTDHREPARGGITETATVTANKDNDSNNRGHPTFTQFCSKCGAWKGQLGLEPSPLMYVEHLMEIFDEVKRVLKPTGACWVNLGDTYATLSGSDFQGNLKATERVHTSTCSVNDSRKSLDKSKFPTKSLCQIPSRFAIAMTDSGWILRNEIVWLKNNQMPSAIKDRFTVDFEKFFFFVKEQRYYFKQQFEPLQEFFNRCMIPGRQTMFGDFTEDEVENEHSKQDIGRNCRTVWGIPTKGERHCHVAMFPKKLIARPIDACCPPDGTVLDPFAGSGTVLEYCYEHDINGIGIEINPEFEPIIKKRMRYGQTRLELE